MSRCECPIIGCGAIHVTKVPDDGTVLCIRDAVRPIWLRHLATQGFPGECSDYRVLMCEPCAKFHQDCKIYT